MRQHIRVIAAAAFAAVLGAGVLPAAADDWDDGYRGGWGRNDGWGDGDWGRRGWGYGSGWGYRGGWNNGAATAALGGFALGAVAGAVAQPGYYGGCYVTRRPIVDYWGNVVSYRSVEVCD